MLLPLVIVNRASAGGGTGESWPGMASDLRKHFGPFNCVFTEAAGDGRALALRAAQEGRRLIIACGGDGTISEVANGIQESGADAELGVLPSGTGGDFRRTLGLPLRTADAARALRTGRARLIDVGRVTYTGSDGRKEQRFFIGVASFGMSGEVIARAKDGGGRWLSKMSARLLGGRLSYAEAMLRTTVSKPNTSVWLRLDDDVERRVTIANLCVANARYFGGGMKIAPQALLNDGLFDIIAIGDLSKLEIIGNAPRLYLGSHLSMDDVHHTRARRLSVRPARKDERISLEVDGELPGHLPATFEILPQALKVRVQSSEFRD